MSVRKNIILCLMSFFMIYSSSLNANPLLKNNQPGKKQTVKKRPPIKFPAPDFTLQDYKGKKFTLSKYKGKLVILAFWATWCPACKSELKVLNDMYKKYNKSGVEILGISVDDTASAIKLFDDYYKIDFPLLVNDMGNNVHQKYRKLYKRRGIPVTLFIDGNGDLLYGFYGYTPKFFFVAAIESLLNKKE